MQERIDLVVVAEERRKADGLRVAVAVSLVLHALLLAYIYDKADDPRLLRAANTPIPRYVELMRQNPQQQQQQQQRQFTEAPGPAIERAPSPNAALSDRNRRASMPEPTGVQPTRRPGEGSPVYTPPSPPPGPRGVQQSAVAPSGGAQAQQQQPQQMTERSPAETRTAPGDASLIYREPVQASATPFIDMAGIRAAARAASRSGDGGPAFPTPGGGGDPGYTADQGPLSFETQWYDWGDYAQSMVSKIRVNWYSNMPQIIRTGLKGVVTIRFTIQRDGRITDVTILKSSGVPPYDQAARRAIELSSPLKALPADFPNPNERVTCMFYYNTEIPRT